MYGDSLGALIVWKAGLFVAVGAGLLGIFAVIRHTRADEEAGRLELVGATAVGRYAALAAALAVTIGACLVVGLLLAVVQIVFRLPAAGSLALGAATALAGCMFAGVAAVTAQLTESARTARGMAISVLGLAYLLRAVGDPAPALSWLSWVSPLGWIERVQPYDGPALVAAAGVRRGHRGAGRGRGGAGRPPGPGCRAGAGPARAGRRRGLAAQPAHAGLAAAAHRPGGLGAGFRGCPPWCWAPRPRASGPR